MVSLRQVLTGSVLAVAASATNWTVTANSNLTFTPDVITAAEGDWLIFQFMPSNHSVVSGPFAAPCRPAQTNGFYAGFNFATSSGPSTNEFAVQVTNASVPIWFYCPQAEHCAAGMVGAVNPTAKKTVAMYQSAAAAFAQSGVVPSGEDFGGSLESVSTSSPIYPSYPSSGGATVAFSFGSSSAALLALGFAIMLA